MTITPELIAGACDFAAWHRMHEQQVADGRTSGPVQTDELAHYTKLNLARANRILKTTAILPELAALVQGIDRPMTWLVITETWCGDAAQSVPVLAQVAALNPLITCRLVLRDEHPDLIDGFLTNGARSIPKILLLDDALTVLAVWGPRPDTLTAQLQADKDAGLLREAMIENAHRWYAQDHTVSVQREFGAVLAGIADIRA
jgi:hypothetical protein